MVTQFVYTVSRKLLFYSVICIKKKKNYTHVLQYLRCTKFVDLLTIIGLSHRYIYFMFIYNPSLF